MNFSLTVATYNRPQFIRRMFTYHAAVGGRYPIHVADDSDGDCLGENKALVRDFIARGLDIRHHVSGRRLGIVESNRVLYDAVDTPFCASTCDDDFTSIEFLDAASAYIALHPDCAAVAGTTASFRTRGDAAFGPVNTITPSSAVPPRTEKSAAARILAYEDGATSVLYFCMRRTADCRDAAALSAALRDSSTTKAISHDFGPAMLEHCIFDHLTLARGHLHCVPHLMLLRHYHQDNVGARLPRWGDFIDVLMDGSWSALAEHYLGPIAAVIAASDGVSQDEARDLAMLCLWTKLEKRLTDGVGKRRARSPHPAPAPRSIPTRILQRLIAALPGRHYGKAPGALSGIDAIRRIVESRESSVSAAQ